MKFHVQHQQLSADELALAYQCVEALRYDAQAQRINTYTSTLHIYNVSTKELNDYRNMYDELALAHHEHLSHALKYKLYISEWGE